MVKHIALFSMNDDIIVEELGTLLYTFCFINIAPVAHLDRVADYESVGSRFESCQAHQQCQALSSFFGLSAFFVCSMWILCNCKEIEISGGKVA